MKNKKLIIGGVVLAAAGLGAFLLLRGKKLQEGAFVRDPVSGAIYVIEGGKKRHIQSMSTWLNKYNGGQYTNEELNMDSAELAKIPTGAPIAGLLGLS